MCESCGAAVAPVTNGSYRNHCPLCLWSKHVDIKPGDRASDCMGMMRPARLDHRSGKGLVIIHRCTRCNVVRANRLARDTVQEDEGASVSDLMRQGLG
jgi:RNHCP domain